jgi:hypothetical protein
MTVDMLKELESKDFYELLGRATQSWSLIEYGICEIFSACISPRDIDPDTGGQTIFDTYRPYAIFYSVENFRSKLAMVDATVDLTLESKDVDAMAIKERWRSAFNRASKLSQKRNRLSHWIILSTNRYSINKDRSEEVMIAPIDLTISHSAATDKFSPIRKRDVISHILTFDKFRTRIFDIQSDLINLKSLKRRFLKDAIDLIGKSNPF